MDVIMINGRLCRNRCKFLSFIIFVILRMDLKRISSVTFDQFSVCFCLLLYSNVWHAGVFHMALTLFFIVKVHVRIVLFY
jgi:hypothetical protein